MMNRGLGDSWAFGKPYRPFMTRRKKRWSGVAALTAFMLLVFATGALAAVWTDKADYAPGEIVTISGDNSNGAGYLAGETVAVSVSGPNGYAASCEGVADENGAWSCQVTLWDSDLAVGTYTYTATGQTSGVSESGTFTDKTNTTVTIGFNPASPAPGVSLTIQGTLTAPSGSPPVPTGLSGKTVDIHGPTTSSTDCNAGAAGSPNNGALVGSPVTDGTGSYSVTTTAPSPATTTTYWFRADYAGDSTYNGHKVCASVTVTVSSNSPPTVGDITGDATVNEGDSKTYSVSASDPDAGDTITYAWNITFGNALINGSSTSSSVTVDFTDGPSAVGLQVVVGDGHAGHDVTKTKSISELNVAPTVPGVPSVTTGSNPNKTGEFSLGWGASTDPGADTISYTLQHKDANDATWSDVASGLNGNSYAFASGNAEAEGTWVYRVKATDSDLADSAFSNASGNVVVDKSAPYAPTLTPGRAAEYDPTPLDTPGDEWWKDSVTVTVTDNGDPALVDGSVGSGIDLSSIPGPFTHSTLGSFTDTATVKDNATNESVSASFSGNVDDSVPTYNCDAAPTGWQSVNVTINCTASDTGSGLNGSSPAAFQLSTTVADGEETANASTGSQLLCDNVGHCVTAGPITGIQVDRKAPQLLSCESPDGLWHALNVTLKCTYTDGGSGPASQDVSLATSVAAGSETDNATASANGAQACDAVNNCASSPADIGGNKVDRKGPSITWNGSISDGDSFYFGFVPAVPTCTASDGGSGPKDCNVTGYGTTVGSHTLTATAHDNVDNATVETRNYTVLAWTLHGFYQPVDMNGVLNTVKNGSTVPLKFNVYAGPTELTDVAVVDSFAVQGMVCPGASTVTDAIEFTTTGGTSLRYDTTAGQFVQNWQTPKKPGACYQVTMTTDDGSSISALFKLK